MNVQLHFPKLFCIHSIRLVNIKVLRWCEKHADIKVTC